MTTATLHMPMPAAPDVPVRHMDFSEDRVNLPRYFYDNDPFASSYFLAFSAVIPHGERFFMESVRNYRDQVRDPGLQERVGGFIGQEAMHGKEHDAVNDAYDAMGFPLRKLDRVSRGGLKLLTRVTPHRFQLAFTVAMEHFTAIVSEYTFRHPTIQAKFTPEARRFMLWHMLEETEHKSVAFDVYQSTGGTYFTRVLAMIVSTGFLIGTLLLFQLWILAIDGSFGTVLRHPRGIAGIYGPRGLWASVFRPYLDFFRPSFHPSHHDTEALLIEIQDRLFSSQHGELKNQLKKTILPRTRTMAAA